MPSADSGKPHCSRCGRLRDGAGRYCKQCHRCYMRAWRRTRITVSRETWQQLQRLMERKGA